MPWRDPLVRGDPAGGQLRVRADHTRR